ncbi:MAG: pyridoxamine 5'-phosphate oxidase family protein [Bacteroidota bacterium]
MAEINNLENQMAFAKMKELSEGIGTCMFCTKLQSPPFHTRPMSVSKVDEDGKFWFMSSAESDKNMEIQHNDFVQLVFSDPSGSRFMSVYGEADILTDNKSIDEAWVPIAKAWFKEGKETPYLTVIKVHPQYAYYWDTKDGKMISLLKIAAAAISGNPADTGVEGALTVNIK